MYKWSDYSYSTFFIMILKLKLSEYDKWYKNKEEIMKYIINIVWWWLKQQDETEHLENKTFISSRVKSYLFKPYFDKDWLAD